MAQHDAKLGWIGLGSMGQAMALNLQAHLSKANAASLSVYNRTSTRCEPVVQAGAVALPTAQAVAQASDICFISLSDDAALKSTITSIEGAWLRDKIIVDTSTVHPDTSAWVNGKLAAHGAVFVAAPVFGASPVAAKGQLLFILAGPSSAIDRISPYLTGVMARAVIHLGEDVTLSSKLKTVGNFLTAGMMELLSETHVLAEKVGLADDVVGTLVDLQYKNLPLTLSRRLTEGHYLPPRHERPWSDLNLAVKDVQVGIDCAASAGASLPIAATVMEHLKAAQAYGEENHRALDSSSMYGVLRQNSGLPFETRVVQERDEQDEGTTATEH